MVLGRSVDLLSEKPGIVLAIFHIQPGPAIRSEFGAGSAFTLPPAESYPTTGHDGTAEGKFSWTRQLKGTSLSTELSLTPYSYGGNEVSRDVGREFRYQVADLSHRPGKAAKVNQDASCPVEAMRARAVLGAKGHERIDSVKISRCSSKTG